MNRPFEQAVCRLADRFVERRVGVDCMHHRLARRFVRQRHTALGDQFGSRRTDDVDAEHFIIFLVGNDFDEARARRQDRGSAVGREGEASDLDVIAALFCLGLAQPDAADLGRAVGTTRNFVVIDRLDMSPCHVLDGQDALRGGYVRQPGRRHTVPDAVDARYIRLHHAVHDDIAALVGLDADLFESDTLRQRPAPDGEQQLVALHFLLFARLVGESDDDAVLAPVAACNLRAQEALDAPPVKGFLELRADLLVLGGYQAGQCLEDRYLGAERAVARGELYADHT